MAASAQASGLLVDPSPRRPRARGAPAPGRLALTLHCTWGLAQGRRGRGQSLGLTAGCWVRLPSDRGSCSLTDEHQTSSGLALSFRLGSSPSPLDALIEYYVASLNGNVTSLLINQSSSGETGSWDRGVYFRRRQPSRVKEPELRRCEGVQNAHTAVAGGAPGLTAAARRASWSLPPAWALPDGSKLKAHCSRGSQVPAAPSVNRERLQRQTSSNLTVSYELLPRLTRYV